MVEPHARWKQLVADLECSESEEATSLIHEGMAEVKALFGIRVADPHPRLQEIEESLARTQKQQQELSAEIKAPSVALAASASAATRWPKDVRYKRAIDAGCHQRAAVKKLKSRMRAISHRAAMCRDRAETKKRGELAFAEAVEALEPQYVEHQIREYSDIEEDDGNEEAKDSWRSRAMVPPWSRLKHIGRAEGCADAPWRLQKKKEPPAGPTWSNVPPMHRAAGAARGRRKMKIHNAGPCHTRGCKRVRSLLWHGERLVGHHAHCCCMCHRSNGQEHAYYCREDGHYYLKDSGEVYTQVFVKDNGKAAADAAWYGASWGHRSWGSQSWGEQWSDTASVSQPAAEGYTTRSAEVADAEDGREEETAPDDEEETALSGVDRFSSSESEWPPQTSE